MNHSEPTNPPESVEPKPRTGKKPYHKPAVRYERVFETSALSCSKVQSTQAQCHNNRKTS